MVIVNQTDKHYVLYSPPDWSLLLLNCGYKINFCTCALGVLGYGIPHNFRGKKVVDLPCRSN